MTFIVIEGLDGSGKTTFIKAFQKILIKNKLNFKQYQGLGSSQLGHEIRKIFLQSDLIHQDTRFFLSIANMVQTFEELIKLDLINNEIVILDRWLASTYAYQLYPFHEQTVILESIFKTVFTQLFIPCDLLVYLDIDPKIGIERKKKQAHHKLDVIEQKPLSYFNQVKDGYYDYLSRIHQGSTLILSSNDPVDNNAMKVFNLLRKKDLL